GLNYPVVLSGETPDLGNFTIEIIDSSGNQIPKIAALKNESIDLHKAQFWGHLVPKGDIWRAKDYLSNLFSERKRKSFADEVDPSPPHLLSIPNKVQENSNLYIFQLMVEAPFQFDILFKSTSSPAHLEDFTSILESKSKNFDTRFENTFGLASKGFDENQISFAHEILSNLIGGIGYFYGTSIVDRSYMNVDEDEENFWDISRQANPQLTSPSSLFTATPSRPFFPRGFYWDEGFHQLLIGNWDNDLSLDIIKHWVSLIDDDGWVAREQILGEEARSKVPHEFQTQYPHYANPPTLLMPLEAFLDRLDYENKLQHSINVLALLCLIKFSAPYPMSFVGISPDLDLSSHIVNFTNSASTRYLNDINLAESYLKEIYQKLKLNYKWFRRTQQGEIKKWGRSASNSEEAYRWRGRTPGHTLTSGLDDYPRPTPPHPAELHVDLMCWVGFMVRSLRDIAKRLNEWHDFEEFDAQYKNIVNNLHDLHWNEVDKTFCDVSFDGEKSIYVCHKGYISLFPMLLGLLPNDSPKLDAILDLMYNPDELWSPYGLRSLSKSSEYYYTGEKYWRGPVWMNINYLALSSLYKNYIAKPGPYQHKADKIYQELRDNIIKNVYKEFKRTGYAWEQYSAINGEGAR
ncbi:28074_t:CDS:10, partial [Dentiscutata erythropus]